jgi:hypothetical protein
MNSRAFRQHLAALLERMRREEAANEKIPSSKKQPRPRQRQRSIEDRAASEDPAVLIHNVEDPPPKKPPETERPRIMLKVHRSR